MGAIAKVQVGGCAQLRRVIWRLRTGHSYAVVRGLRDRTRVPAA